MEATTGSVLSTSTLQHWALPTYILMSQNKTQVFFFFKAPWMLTSHIDKKLGLFPVQYLTCDDVGEFASRNAKQGTIFRQGLCIYTISVRPYTLFY